MSIRYEGADAVSVNCGITQGANERALGFIAAMLVGISPWIGLVIGLVS